MVIKKYMIIL